MSKSQTVKKNKNKNTALLSWCRENKVRGEALVHVDSFTCFDVSNSSCWVFLVRQRPLTCVVYSSSSPEEGDRYSSTETNWKMYFLLISYRLFSWDGQILIADTSNKEITNWFSIVSDFRFKRRPWWKIKRGRKRCGVQRESGCCCCPREMLIQESHTI